MKELLSRGHHVVAVVRDPDKLAPAENVTIARHDLSDVSENVAHILIGADAAVSAYGPPPNRPHEVVTVTDLLVRAVCDVGCPRLIVVGGAASLYVDFGVTLLDSGHLPEEWVPIATAHSRVLALLKDSDINWTYFSPAGCVLRTRCAHG